MENHPFYEELESVLLALEGMDRNPKLKHAHLGNALSLLHQCLGEKSWVGLYLDEGDELILGSFQGTPACEEIAYGKGVVGECFIKNETMVVPDVTKHPNYICCDSSAKSEICVPMKRGDQPFAILDIDLPYPYEFPANIREIIEKIAAKLALFC